MARDNAALYDASGSGTSNFSGAISLGTTPTIAAASGGTLALSGVISGSGNLTTLGAINLSATNTYSGTTTINTGILSATTAGALVRAILRSAMALNSI